MENDELVKLEREVKFLNESLEAGIISEEEFERKMEDIAERRAEVMENGDLQEKHIVEHEEPIIEERVEPLIQIKIDNNEVKEEPRVESTEEPKEEKEEVKEENKELPIYEEESSGIWKWILGSAVVLLVLFLFFSSNTNVQPQVISQPELPRVGATVTIINDKNCLFCDTQRMKSVITQLFPGIDINEQDISESSEFQSEMKALPSYVFDQNISNAKGFDEFKRAVDKNEDYYVMKSSASGAPFYFKRTATKGTLDVFINPNDPAADQIQKTLDEVQTYFGRDIKISTIKTTFDSRMATELDITSSPTFLVNNQFKFSGIYTAPALEEKFCMMNNVKGCKK